MPKSMREREGWDPLPERGRNRMPGGCNGNPLVQADLKMGYENFKAGLTQTNEGVRVLS